MREYADGDAVKAGRELDALVAEHVMGWKPHASNPYGIAVWWYASPVPGRPPRSFQPSENVAHAFEAAECVMDRTKWRFQCGYSCGLNGRPRWYAFFGDPADASGAADTAPLAICLAALKAVGAEVAV